MALDVIMAPKECAGRHICVFVTYSENGHLKRHVRLHVDRLISAGIEVMLVLVTNAEPRGLRKTGQLAGLAIRDNAGFDFGAWADTLRSQPQLWECKTLLFINDSIFGPFGDYRRTLSRVLDSSADVVGLTESLEECRHFQTYFFALKNNALSAAAIRGFWGGVKNLATKRDVIREYELKLLQLSETAGLQCDLLFPRDATGSLRQNNPLKAGWSSLILRGFPYVKVELLRDNPSRIFIDNWRTAVNDPAVIRAIEDYLIRNR